MEVILKEDEPLAGLFVETSCPEDLHSWLDHVLEEVYCSNTVFFSFGTQWKVEKGSKKYHILNIR